MNNDMSEDNSPEPVDLMAGLDSGDTPSELDKIFKQMLDPANLSHFTELNKQEIIGFSSINTMRELARKYGIDYSIIDNWVLENLKFRVSLSRKGRLELVKITARNSDNVPQQGNGQSGPWNMFRR